VVPAPTGGNRGRVGKPRRSADRLIPASTRGRYREVCLTSGCCCWWRGTRIGVRSLAGCGAGGCFRISASSKIAASLSLDRVALSSPGEGETNSL
jgi:hypothetical protein